MSTIAYQCPCCGAPLQYGAQSGKLECAACGNSYELDAIEAFSDSGEQGSIEFQMPTASFSKQEEEHMQAYTCQGCGAELMTEDTTTATECPYCGSPIVLPERINSGVKPEMVVPFTVTREEAQRLFEGYFKGKKLLPNVFLHTRNRIAEMRKLYVPYWLFDCSAGGSVVYDAQKKYARREGEWEVTYTEHYVLTRAGRLDFKGIPVDGSVKLGNQITESLEPYDLGAAVPFAPAVLAGALADHADVDSEACQERARQRVENSMEEALRSTVSGYTLVTARRQNYRAAESKVTPVLMPVWLITTEKDGQTYTFAINGQTGKLTCDVPADKKKSFLWGFGVFAAVLAVMCALLYAGGMLEDGTLLIAAILSLIAGIGTVGVLVGQLKQAVSAQSAGEYIIRDSFALDVRRDHHLYTTKTRRRIDQGPQAGPMHQGPSQMGSMNRQPPQMGAMRQRPGQRGPMSGMPPQMGPMNRRAPQAGPGMKRPPRMRPMNKR